MLPIGEEFLDYASGQKMVCNKSNYEQITKGIVEVILVNGNNVEIKLGYFIADRATNIIVSINGDTKTALGTHIFPNKTLVFFNPNNTYHMVTPDQYAKQNALGKIKSSGHFPYRTISRNYDAASNLDNFKKTKKTFEDNFKVDVTKLFKYSFGIEFETSRGYVPEEKCYGLGLIPLRDGSISGVEYATIPMDKNNGFPLLEEQLNILEKCTDFDKECSLHVHMGGFPVDSKHIEILYSVCRRLEDSILWSVPKYTFDTHAYKNNGKDYCKRLKGYSDFDSLYYDLSQGTSYLGSLTQAHPSDGRREAKWNISSRYRWLNIINMCFYPKPKTVEFRFLRPTYNFNKIVNWLYIFNAILLYVEKLVDNNSKKSAKTILSETFSKWENSPACDLLPAIICDIYGNKPDMCKILIEFLRDLNEVCAYQHATKDYWGATTGIEDGVILKNVLTDN